MIKHLTILLLAMIFAVPLLAQAPENPLHLPAVGEMRATALTPAVLAVTRITTATETEVGGWQFTAASLPLAEQFRVQCGEKVFAVKEVGCRRRALYAPLKTRDLRVEHVLYLRLADPLPEGVRATVKNLDGALWDADKPLTVTTAPERWSPLLHVNQVGYAPDWPKRAYLGAYLGTLGELTIPATMFQVVEAGSGKVAFTGTLRSRPDRGFTYADPPYQQVLEADFSALVQPGAYQLAVPGLGRSYPFRIDDGCAATLARTYALGCYHQRCGAATALPFTRFTHAACHTAAAAIPTMGAEFREVNACLDHRSAQPGQGDQQAPRLKNVDACLYPFVKTGTVDVSGGHHDAGDYSKYTNNSAQFIHYLVFAVDYLPGVAALDNLGLPESGDHVSDVLQIAECEADFLLKMQDDDGGFFFLVYPRTRAYEDNVLPDHGDAQVVFPKNTAATAAATAALAQISSSPTLQAADPAAAKRYLAAARRGWDFLEAAWEAHGREGAYQKITHYGDMFSDTDEIAWAETELFIATGEEKFQERLLEDFLPGDPKTRHWGWVRLSECYGHAIRSYAFAARAGRIPKEKVNAAFAAACRKEITLLGAERVADAQHCAYGVSYPAESKRHRTAGWFFGTDQAFDALVAAQLDPQPALFETIISNCSFELGANPVNVTFLTGLGSHRQREIVHQYAENDRRALPPSGIPLGCLQNGFMYYAPYNALLGKMSIPSDDDPEHPYPLYDRWGDSFNTATEFTVLTLGRSLAVTAWLMARTSLRDQAWRSATGEILLSHPLHAGRPVTATLQAPGDPQIVWETPGQEPALGPTFTFTPATPGASWIEAEALYPDGRRIVAVYEGTVIPSMLPPETRVKE